MDWVIEALTKSHRYKSRDKYDNNKRKRLVRESYRLKLCSVCDRVWENETIGTIAYYKNFPTYGLKRVSCRHCKGESHTTYKNKKRIKE